MCIMLNYFKGSVNIDHTSEEWTDAIDRGGLIHVNDMLYMFLMPWKRKFEEISMKRLLVRMRE